MFTVALVVPGVVVHLKVVNSVYQGLRVGVVLINALTAILEHGRVLAFVIVSPREIELERIRCV